MPQSVGKIRAKLPGIKPQCADRVENAADVLCAKDGTGLAVGIEDFVILCSPLAHIAMPIGKNSEKLKECECFALRRHFYLRFFRCSKGRVLKRGALANT